MRAVHQPIRAARAPSISFDLFVLERFKALNRATQETL